MRYSSKIEVRYGESKMAIDAFLTQHSPLIQGSSIST